MRTTHTLLNKNNPETLDSAIVGGSTAGSFVGRAVVVTTGENMSGGEEKLVLVANGGVGGGDIPGLLSVHVKDGAK